MPATNDKDRGDLLRGALEMLILRTLEPPGHARVRHNRVDPRRVT